jgi:CHAD domain-containing protein
MARPESRFPADISFKEAARRLLLAALDRMLENADGTAAGDVEALHDMRVGSRRLRAALSVFGKIFPAAELRELDRRVKRVTDALGAVRDLDVQIESLTALQAGLAENEIYGIGRAIKRLGRQRERERVAMVRAIERLKKGKFERRFRRALDKAAPEPEAR